MLCHIILNISGISLMTLGTNWILYFKIRGKYFWIQTLFYLWIINVNKRLQKSRTKRLSSSNCIKSFISRNTGCSLINFFYFSKKNILKAVFNTWFFAYFLEIHQSTFDKIEVLDKFWLFKILMIWKDYFLERKFISIA